MTAGQALRPDLMLAYVLWIGIVGFAFNTGLVLAQRRLFGQAARVEAGAMKRARLALRRARGHRPHDRALGRDRRAEARFAGLPAGARADLDGAAAWSSPMPTSPPNSSARFGHMIGGWLVASIFGVALGALVGSSRAAREYVAPTLEFLRPLPASAVIPVAIAMFGLTPQMALGVIGFGSIWPALLAAVHGFAAVEPRLLEVERALGLSPLAGNRENLAALGHAGHPGGPQARPHRLLHPRRRLRNDRRPRRPRPMGPARRARL